MDRSSILRASTIGNKCELPSSQDDFELDGGSFFIAQTFIIAETAIPEL